MKFTKLHWFYETEVNGITVGVQKTQNNRLWEATGNKGTIAIGKTRKEAVENYFKENEGRI